MRKSHKTVSVSRHLKDNKSKVTSSHFLVKIISKLERIQSNLITSELKVRLTRCKTGLSPPVKYFTNRSKTVLHLWIFYLLFCLVFAMPLCATVYMCLVVTRLERADLLALVCGVSLSLSHWYPGSGVVLDCIDS